MWRGLKKTLTTQNHQKAKAYKLKKLQEPRVINEFDKIFLETMSFSTEEGTIQPGKLQNLLNVGDLLYSLNFEC